MSKRLIALIISAVMMCSALPVSFAADTLITCFEISSDSAMTTDKYALANLTDGDEATSAMFTPVQNAEIVFASESPVDITSMRLAVENFPGWRHVKTVSVTYNDTITETIDVPDFADDIRWFDGGTVVNDVTKVSVKITGVYDNISFDSGALAEIEFYGVQPFDAKATGTGTVSASSRKLNYLSDFKYVTTNSKIAAVANWFDGNHETHTNISTVKGSFMVLQFQYPTDVTSFSLWSVNNNDWAMIKEIEFGHYDETTRYRSRLKYPSPAYEGKTYPLEETTAKQTIDLSDCEDMKQITHLIVRFNDAYEFSTGATWGGVTEFEIEGIPNTSAQLVSESIRTELVSNPSIIYEWGLLGDVEYDITRKPTRMEAADMILRLIGEYDTANSYVGTYNFADATDKPCAMNRLSYIFAYKKFGMQGDEYGRFKPNAYVQPKEFYKMILSMLGYNYGSDFTWDTIHQKVRSMGAVGDMLYTDPFTVKDMCNVVWEALNVIPKGGDVILAEKLHNDGLMPEEIWNKFADKYDKQIVEVDRTEYAPPADVNKSGDFTFTTSENPHDVSKWHFMYNACFHYSGVYYGTLPRNNPESQRDAFAAALKDIGAQTLRWPGGNTVHWYFWEGERFAKQLFEDAASFMKVRPGGFYDPQDPDDRYYAEVWDFLDFCKEYDIDVLMQINPMYYVDQGDPDDPNDDRVRNVILESLNSKSDANGNRYTIPGYYDGQRIEEGAEALRRNLKEMKARGYECYMWEIGNEDHWKDYDGREYGENQFIQDSFDMIVAYTKVIKEEFPGSVVCVDTFDVAKAVEKGVITAEEASMLDAVTDHYPFARWGAPAVNTDSGKRNAWPFASNNDALIEQAWINRQALNWGVPQRMITESTAYRFQNWGSTNVEHTFAHALVLGHNWGQAVFDSGWTLACLHDLESQWLGFLQHNSSFNVGYRYFSRQYEGHANLHEDDIPDNYKFYGDRYYTNPAGKAFEILGRHAGGQALENPDTNMSRYVAGYATRNGNKVTVTIVNRLNETRPVTIKLGDITVPEQTVNAAVLRTNDIFAVMEEDYIYSEDTQIKIIGNENNVNAVETEVTPFSITQFTFDVK